ALLVGAGAGRRTVALLVTPGRVRSAAVVPVALRLAVGLLVVLRGVFVAVASPIAPGEVCCGVIVPVTLRRVRGAVAVPVALRGAGAGAVLARAVVLRARLLARQAHVVGHHEADRGTVIRAGVGGPGDGRRRCAVAGRGR